MLRTLAVEGYRSLRHLAVPLAPLTIVTGENGSGKSTLYRALSLLAAAAHDGAVAALAREGGIGSALWAGPENGSGRHGGPTQGTVRRRPVSLRVGFSGDDLGYAIDLGLPTPPTRFVLDPEIKRESVWAGPVLTPAGELVDRANGAVRIRDDEGRWQQVDHPLRPYESVLGELGDPRGAPELLALRDRLRRWRFYDQLRTDAHAPARTDPIATRTVSLASDGGDLAAAMATIEDVGDADALQAAVRSAFPGSRVQVQERDGRFRLVLHQPGLLRPLSMAEVSDGTLRYLLWVAALGTVRPPPLLVLNEPETSLHPGLLPALAELVAGAAQRSQVVVVSHSVAFCSLLEQSSPDSRSVELARGTDGTVVVDQGRLDEPSWRWPGR
ncbi:AAA family ATPase [Nakamurella endophytica]|uniref:ATPase AAA-type core domain-containing protein n=1 Tax=Nakamurella endophytica TaxID=1748367 RepID=A0A917WK42_9ACTN|nr:AAA family ATPase [Nakamurella endophytica]GGM10932.1 hypothetical protein GCM10011594_33580 [Nakamurella endophytica]